MESPCEVDPPVEIFELENTFIFIFDSADEIDREQIVNKNTVLQNISKAFLIIFFSRCGLQKVNLNCECYLYIQLWCAESILQLNALTS